MYLYLSTHSQINGLLSNAKVSPMGRIVRENGVKMSYRSTCSIRSRGLIKHKILVHCRCFWLNFVRIANSVAGIILILFLLSIFLCSCSKRNNSVSTIMLNDIEFNISFLNKLKSDTVTIPLSRLVDGCELVHLEYSEEALFKPDITTVTDNYIGVSQELGDYKLFSRSGKFLCSIGSIGQGPGEYIAVNDCIIDDNNGLVYLAPIFSDKIYVYNTSGRFLRNIEIPQFFIYAIPYLSDDILTIVYIPITEDKSIAIKINIHTGQILNEFTTQIPQPERGGFASSRNIKNIFDLSHALSDTIYHFDIQNNSIRPIFTTSDNFSNEVTKRHVQINKNLVLTAIRSKGVLIATDMKNKRSSFIKVKNDFFGNIDLPISIYFYLNGYFTYNVQPEQLMEDIKQHLSDSNCTEKDRQMLKKTLSTLKEGENNVVFIGKLKNEVENLF